MKNRKLFSYIAVSCAALLSLSAYAADTMDTSSTSPDRATSDSMNKAPSVDSQKPGTMGDPALNTQSQAETTVTKKYKKHRTGKPTKDTDKMSPDSKGTTTQDQVTTESRDTKKSEQQPGAMDSSLPGSTNSMENTPSSNPSS